MPEITVATVVGDDHAGWTCEMGASLIAEAYFGVLRGVIYVCPEHRAAAEARILCAGYSHEVRPAPASHRHDPWPCGHITTYDDQAAAELARAARSEAWHQSARGDADA